jgi:hypothetical protein
MTIAKRLLVVAAAMGVGNVLTTSAEASPKTDVGACMKRLANAEGEAAPIARKIAAANCDIQYTRYDPKRKKRRNRKGCFLTTACCDMAGLADDCFELRVLRQFRDTVLSRMPGGREEIELYYDVGPGIAEAIARPGEERALAKVYAGTILPCVGLILVGAHGAARARYVAMVRGLMDRYGIVSAP